MQITELCLNVTCGFSHLHRHCHEREVQLAMSEEKQLKTFMPKVYNVLRIPNKVTVCCLFFVYLFCLRRYSEDILWLQLLLLLLTMTLMSR